MTFIGQGKRTIECSGEEICFVLDLNQQCNCFVASGTGLKLGISGITFVLPSSSSFSHGSYDVDTKTGWKIQDDGYASISFASFEGDSRQVGSLLGQT